MKPLYNCYPATMLIVVALLAFSSQLCAQQTISAYIDDEWPDSRYTINADNTVTDTQTKLMWQRCSAGQSQTSTICVGNASTINWLGALELAQNADTAGYTDWRLPNTKELASITAYDRHAPAINSNIFPNTFAGFYWSSTPTANFSNTGADVIDFNDGSDAANLRNNSSSTRVRLVRDVD